MAEGKGITTLVQSELPLAVLNSACVTVCDFTTAKEGLFWACQEHFTHTATTFTTDSFWYCEPCFQPVQNINATVLHFINPIDVIHYTDISVC